MKGEHMSEHVGGCHCGNIELRVTLTQPPEDTEVRADQCSFCRKHDALSISDPAGLVRLTVKDESLLSRYRFGLKTADFFVCARCGVYVAALCETPAGPKTVVNIRALADCELFTANPRAVSYDAEDIARRLARRAERWMPVELSL
jgi:hypothetical protein